MFDRSTARATVARPARIVTIALFSMLLGTQFSVAQTFPERGGFNERDDVTGYLCVTPQCDVLRLPGANCICTKDNPGEYRLSRLKLTCRTKSGGQWVACPVKPRYGN